MRADDPGALAVAVPIAQEGPTLAAELLERYRARHPVRGVVVTDLLDPRAAYWRSISPIAPTSEQAGRLREGQRLHERLGRKLGPTPTREFRVRRDGIVGRIDVFDGRPLEMKSTDSPPRDGDDLRTSRPPYIEQLAMYAALVERHDGRLVVVRVAREGSPQVRVWDIAVDDLEQVRSEMRDRADRLRRARELRDPSGLPRCGWYERGCAHRAAGTCDCSGAEVPLPGTVLSQVSLPQPEPSEAARIAELVANLAPEPTAFARFRDLAYPRRSYFDSVADAAPEPFAPDGESDETWSAVQALLEDGPPGEYEVRFAPSGEPSEGVACLRGEPVLVKSSRSLRPTPAERLVAERPHYILELALRCAAVGAPAGWLVLGLERVPSEGDWIRTQRVEFGAPAELLRLLERRAELLAGARRRSDPSGLPACPLWMNERCPHRAVCGCADAAAPGRT